MESYSEKHYKNLKKIKVKFTKIEIILNFSEINRKMDSFLNAESHFGLGLGTFRR